MTPTHMIGKSVPKRSGPTGPGLSQIHGVLVVPGLHRVYATATGTNRVVRIDEDTGRVLGGTATGAYPDGLAYDPANGTIWTTNESGGSETIINAATGAASRMTAKHPSASLSIFLNIFILNVSPLTPIDPSLPQFDSASARGRGIVHSKPDENNLHGRYGKAAFCFELDE